MRGRVVAILAFAVFSPLSASAEVKFEVGGAVESADENLEVRVDVINRGDGAASSLDVRGELGDGVDVATMPNGVPPRATRSVILRFAHVPPAGVHVLGLRLDYTEAAAPGRTALSTSQRAYLLLSLGATPPAALRITAGDVTLQTRGTVPVRVFSADGAPHRARVRVLTPRGLNADEPVEVDVPASGGVTAFVPVLRGGVPRPSRQGIVVVAEVLDAEVAQASVVASLLHVAEDPALLPKLRPWLAALVVALLLAAGLVQIRARRPSAERPAEAARAETEARPSS